MLDAKGWIANGWLANSWIASASQRIPSEQSPIQAIACIPEAIPVAVTGKHRESAAAGDIAWKIVLAIRAAWAIARHRWRRGRASASEPGGSPGEGLVSDVDSGGCACAAMGSSNCLGVRWRRPDSRFLRFARNDNGLIKTAACVARDDKPRGHRIFDVLQSPYRAGTCLSAKRRADLGEYGVRSN
jgi:hypothetical protein